MGGVTFAGDGGVREMTHRGDYSGLRFCPKCGVGSLEFDRYREPKNFPIAEYICMTCGFGFRISQSKRVQDADVMFKRDRQLRTNKFEMGVTPATAEKWVEFTEKRHERWYKRLLKRGTTG